MSRFRAGLFVTTLISFVYGCSVRPLPVPFSSNASLLIAQKIRCELSEAARITVIKALQRKSSIGIAPRSIDASYNEPQGKIARDLIKHFDSKDFLKIIDKSLISPELTYSINLFRKTQIGLAFRFEISEIKQSDSTISLTGPTLSPKFDIKLMPKLSMDRYNERSFYVTLTGEDLMSPTILEACYNNRSDRKSYVPESPSVAYPITGNLNLAELVETFAALQLSGQLANEKTANVSLFVDTIRFTTTIDLNFTPEITIDRVGVSGININSAKIINNNQRKDLHELKILLSIPDEEDLDAYRTTVKLIKSTLSERKNRRLAVPNIAKLEQLVTILENKQNIQKDIVDTLREDQRLDALRELGIN